MFQNFAMIMIIFIFGFSVGFFFLVGGKIHDFRTINVSAFTLFRGLVGDFDFKSLDSHLLDSAVLVVANLMFSVYLSISLIVLFNLLIGKSLDKKELILNTFTYV